LLTIVNKPGILAFGSKAKNPPPPMARSAHINAAFTDAERARLAAAAAAAGMRPTTWLHRVAMLALDAAPGPPPPLPPVPPELAPEPPGNLRRMAGTRFTAAQHAIIADRAKECGLSVSAYVRTVVLGGTPVVRRSEVRSAIVAVNRVGGNLNQVVKLANTGVVLPPDLLREVHAVRAEIDALRQAFLASLRGEPSEAPEALA